MEVDLSNLRGSYDLIVIGSGPAGLTLAHKYDALTTGRTLLVESGPRTIVDSEAQKLAVVEASGDISAARYSSLHSQRMFGGTSIVWDGFCGVLEKRPFLNDEWPFAYDELYMVPGSREDPEPSRRSPCTPGETLSRQPQYRLQTILSQPADAFQLFV